MNCDYNLDASSCSTDDENAAVMCSETQSELVILCKLEHACKRNAFLSLFTDLMLTFVIVLGEKNLLLGVDYCTLSQDKLFIQVNDWTT